ncbi:FMN-binding negative transcriptional regulator [Spirosoma sp. KUDC1026]|nr:FMN-binding negative transcriptional regulator [Spirosoma sp. KUDC1026]
MYVPRPFQFTDKPELIAFMKRYSFATIVTVREGVPIATQLPFVIDDSTEALRLCAHFSRVNEQARYMETETSLVIFTEPHAYISPSHYDNRESVPTWDYVAVHAYGNGKILPDQEAKTRSLLQTIQFYEPAYLEQWNTLSETYKQSMLQGIVAFELEVTDLQGQKKLSQNKTAAEKQRIIQHLEASEVSGERDVAAYIRTL